jgi:PRTRC genetic system ThiF family protein
MKKVFHTPTEFLVRPITISLIGAGGTGSHVADGLASLECTLRNLGHPGFRVNLYDAGRVRRANIGRQRFTEADIGHYKVDVLTHRLNMFYQLGWVANARNVEPGHDVLGDLVLTCTDSAIFRAKLGKAYRERTSHTLWLDVGNGAMSGQAILGHLAGKTNAPMRLPNVFDLYPELSKMQAADRDAPSCSMEEAIARQEWPINRLVATACVTLLWNLLRKGAITDHGCQMNTGMLQMTPLAIDPQAWEFFGYSSPDLAAPKAKSRTRARKVA